MRTPMKRKDAPVETALTLWKLTAKDRQEPPYHFANVAHTVIVAAHSAEHARRLAGADHGVHWHDETMAECAEFAPTEPGVVAHLV